MSPRYRLVAVLAAATLSAASGCSSSTSADTSSAGAGRSATADRATISGTITVFAAASLTEAFTAIGKQFEATHPGVRVKFNFGASSTLALQINQGAPADLFASASTKNLQEVIGTGRASTAIDFAKNVMAIAVPPRNPGNVTSLADLAKRGVKVALCQPQVPCGVTAAKVFAKAGLKVEPVTLEQSVKSTLAKVELNEVDAGIVYVTDVRAAGSKVKAIVIPADVNASTTYPIATLTEAPNARGAQSFLDYVLSAEALRVLTDDGFLAP